jgi:probable HAF family extracellular repeat protein
LRACLFDANGGGNNKDLGTFGGYYQNSVAHCINDNGQIVGAVWDSTTFYSPPPYWRACLFDPNGTGNNIDLNSLIDPNCGWLLEDAWGINNNGWIVGQGVNPNGQYHAFLLVPEPTTICLLCLGGLSILIRRKT